MLQRLDYNQAAVIADDLVDRFLAGDVDHVTARFQELGPYDSVGVAFLMSRPLGDHHRDRLVQAIRYAQDKMRGR